MWSSVPPRWAGFWYEDGKRTDRVQRSDGDGNGCKVHVVNLIPGFWIDSRCFSAHVSQLIIPASSPVILVLHQMQEGP